MELRPRGPPPVNFAGRAEAGREGERERERGRKDRSFTKREQHREKHLLELPLTRSS